MKKLLISLFGLMIVISSPFMFCGYDHKCLRSEKIPVMGLELNDRGGVSISVKPGVLGQTMAVCAFSDVRGRKFGQTISWGNNQQRALKDVDRLIAAIPSCYQLDVEVLKNNITEFLKGPPDYS